MRFAKRLAPLSVLLLIVGCGLQEIPLFNNSASLTNRIYSAREVRTELNNEIVSARESGWLTQAQIDAHFSPTLDATKRLVDEADALRIAGEGDASANKLTAAKALLKTLRDELIRIQKEHP